MAKHKCFISYHKDDKDEVEAFIKTFAEAGDAFISRHVGVMDQDIIDSDNKDYIMRRIREKYLSDSTVTIVLVGKCTKARKYVDWEVASTLRNDTVNKRSGLLAINLPSMGSTGALPERVSDNYRKDEESYALYRVYPKTVAELKGWIEEAFQNRADAEKIKLIDNSRDLYKNNRACQ